MLVATSNTKANSTTNTDKTINPCTLYKYNKKFNHKYTWMESSVGLCPVDTMLQLVWSTLHRCDKINEYHWGGSYHI